MPLARAIKLAIDYFFRGQGTGHLISASALRGADPDDGEKITFIRGENNFVPFDESLVNREKVGYLLTWSRFGSSEVEAASVSI